MEEKQIIESNKLIAEFMGWEFGKYQNLPNKAHKIIDGQESGWNLNNMDYDGDWNQLMPVVENIEGLGNAICNEYFWNKDDSKQHNDFRLFRVSDIKELHSQVIQFIQWYNSTPNK